MNKPGRPSSASLAIVPNHGPAELEVHQRPAPPPELSDEEATEWDIITATRQATWFGPETFPLLAQYCRHIVRSRRIAQLIHDLEAPPAPKKGEEAPAFDVATYNAYLRMQERESRALAMLATKMRLSQQTCIDREAKKKGVGKRPWQDS
jgi:hypothetical protein